MNPFDELRADDGPPADDGGRLNHLRVRAVVAERRAAERRRTWRRVGFLAAVALVARSIIAVADAGRAAHAGLIAVYVLLGLAGGIAVRAWRPRPVCPAVPPPGLPPPDFTGLSNGSQFAQNLERVDERPDRVRQVTTPHDGVPAAGPSEDSVYSSPELSGDSACIE